MLYPSIKALHIISIICWIASLLYLVRLFVYHAQSKEQSKSAALINQFSMMEKRLLKGIANPAMLASIFFGFYLLYLQPSLATQPWFFVKVVAVILLIAYHICCGKIRKQFESQSKCNSSQCLRVFNEFSTILMIFIVFLVETHNIFLSSVITVGIAIVIFISLKLLCKK